MPLLPKMPASPGLPPEASGPILPSSGMPKLPGQQASGKPQPGIGSLLSGFAPTKAPGGSVSGQPQSSAPGIVPAQPFASYRFQERADYEKGFAAYYDEKIKPVVKQLDQTRTEKLEQVKKNRPKANMIFFGVLAVAISLTYLTRSVFFLIVGVIIAWASRNHMINGPKDELAGMIKEQVIPLVVKFFGNYEYSSHGEIGEEILSKSKIFESFNRYSSEDYITGRYRDTQFAFAEIDLAYHSSGGRHHSGSTRTVFKGMAIVLQMSRPATGMTAVKGEGQKGLWAWMTGKSGGLQNVKFENPEFEKIFEVYSTDENEARSLVTPDFIQRLMKLKQMYSSSAVRCCFFENRLLLAVSRGESEKGDNMFEAGVSQDMEINLDDLHAYLAQFKGILDIIDTVVPPKTGIEKTI